MPMLLTRPVVPMADEKQGILLAVMLVGLVGVGRLR